ncbi:MAG: hypothetical protein LBT44_05645 [Clostridiales bacterium]|nr:hypothetical protein [Clostridiales bacterium]
MDDRVIVNDENNVKIGKTYPRRARQLVHKQRAIWADEMQTAIRLSPTVEDREWVEAEPVIEMEIASEAAPASSWDERWLYALAEKRVRQRKWFIFHSCGLIPGFIVLVLFWSAVGGGYDTDLFFCFLLGGWSTPYVIHVCAFVKSRSKDFRRRSETEKIKIEMEKLKAMEPK